jgi:hypothetical protein
LFGPGKRSAGPGIGELIGQVTQDGKAAIKAEIDLYKAIAVHRASGLKIGVPLLIVALFVLQAVVTAIFVGVLFALAGWIGAGWATLATAVLGFALVGLLAWLGIRRARTLFAPIDEVTP